MPGWIERSVRILKILHLLPVKDPRLVEQLANLEARKPDPQNLPAYAAWKSSVDSVRAQIRQQAAAVMDDARLAALTTTRGVFTFEDLSMRSPFDLVVFDEASQVSIAHALALTPLGRRCLFAGDPEQLAPVVRSSHPLAQRWLGESMFSIMDSDSPSTCFLDEQLRMAGSICRAVSSVFYRGKLKLASRCGEDEDWKKWRDIPRLPRLGDRSTAFVATSGEGKWSQKYHGPIRYESAELVSCMVQEICRSTAEQDVIVLTPFRAQRTLLRAFLRSAGLKKVAVSTVHRAQGSERHTVIFDPVNAENDFLKTENAKRLVNVALSRAQARLVLVLSASDRSNPLFNQLATVMDHSRSAISVETGKPISEFTSRDDYPVCLLDQVVSYRTITGKVVAIQDNGRYLMVVNLADGQAVTWSSDTIRREFRPAGPVTPEPQKPKPPPKVEQPKPHKPTRPASPATAADILGGYWRR